MRAAIVVLDAANGLGRGVVAAALRDGRPVIAVSDDEDSLQALHQQHPGSDLTTVLGSVDDEASGSTLAMHLRELYRPIAGVVAAICTEPMRGRVLDQPLRVLTDGLAEELSPHFIAARSLLPLLSGSGRNGGYVVIGSPGSEHPWAGYGHRSIAAAAINMLVRVLHDEARALGVRVQLLAINRPARTDDNRDCACEGWPSAVAIGAQALGLIDQVEPRQAAFAVVPFVKDTPVPLDSAPPTPVARTVVEPVAVPPEDRRHLDQAWNLLEPLFSSHRPEEKHS